MSFQLTAENDVLQQIILISAKYLEENHSEEADPGLCILSSSDLIHPEKLISYGFRAKSEFIQLEEAYKLAEELNIHLSAHGGTGEGVIGALAGAGLRLSGNDGKFRKTVPIDINCEEMSVSTLIIQAGIECICDIDGNELDGNTNIFIRDRIKKIIKNNKTALLVKKVIIENEEMWTNYTIQELKELNL